MGTKSKHKFHFMFVSRCVIQCDGSLSYRKMFFSCILMGGDFKNKVNTSKRISCAINAMCHLCHVYCGACMDFVIQVGFPLFSICLCHSLS